MTGEHFFDVFGEIDSVYILAAEETLEKAEGRAARFSRRKCIRTALIAAAIAGLLTAAAYAAGLFGLQARLIPDAEAADQSFTVPKKAEKTWEDLRNIHHRDYVSLSGVSGSPEYRAAAEWLAFQGAYAEAMTARQLQQGEVYYEWRDLERSFAPDEETRAICRLYQVWDEAMWDKLWEIAENYGLQLHTERSILPGDELPGREHGKYEDGSFLATVGITLEGEFCWFDCYFERNGFLPADSMAISGAEEYEEWEYKNAQGDMVSIAMREDSQEAGTFLIFYNGNGTCITLSARRNSETKGLPEEDRLFAELLADTVNFERAAASKTPEEAIAALKGEET